MNPIEQEYVKGIMQAIYAGDDEFARSLAAELKAYRKELATC